LYQVCPVADGLVDTVGSEADTVASVKAASVAESPVKLLPSPSLLSSVPVASGSVIVLSVLVLGAVTVSIPVPLACPVIFTFAIYYSYYEILPLNPPTFFQTLAPALILVQMYWSPVVLLIQKCPVADGLVDTVGSEADTVASDKALIVVGPAPVKLEPSPSVVNRVPVASGKVIVLSEFVLGAAIVSIPVAPSYPCTFTLAIYYSYAITQVEPLGTVTEYPEATVIGPADSAL